MGWKGIAFGAWIGSLFGGPLGALLGGALGHQVEKTFGGGAPANPLQGMASSNNRSMLFCATAAAMLAKIAKADGRVTTREIASVENGFRRLGFTSATRDYACSVFRKAKDDRHTIYDYAREFAGVVTSVEVRELFYEILWDVACADGTISAHELEILRHVTVALGIRTDWYDYFASQRLRQHQTSPARDPLAEAYVVLGGKPSQSPEELKTLYRNLAKKNHPDALRSQGLPEEMIGKAEEKMARINAAWNTIREARGL